MTAVQITYRRQQIQTLNFKRVQNSQFLVTLWVYKNQRATNPRQRQIKAAINNDLNGLEN